MVNGFSPKLWFYLDREPNLLLGSYIWSVTALSLSDSVFCVGGLPAVRHVRFSDERNRAPKSIVAWQILKGFGKISNAIGQSFLCNLLVVFSSVFISEVVEMGRLWWRVNCFGLRTERGALAGELRVWALITFQFNNFSEMITQIWELIWLKLTATSYYF